MPPQLIFPDLNYDCIQCGKGCKIDWEIRVLNESAAEIEKTQAALELRKAGFTPLEDLDPEYKVIGRREDSHCHFLRSDNLCSIHAESGIETKPRPCREFPFRPLLTPDGIYVGVSFFCTAVQQNIGRPLSAHRQSIEGIASDLGMSETPKMTVQLTAQNLAPWETYRHLESGLLEDLQRMPSAEAFLRTACRLANFRPDQAWSGREQSPPTNFDPGMIQDLLEVFFGSVLAIVESPQDRDHRPTITDSYLNRASYFSPRLEREIPVISVESPVISVESPAAWFTAETQRYFKHVVFRKDLLIGTVLSQLLFFALIEKLLVYYTTLHALLRESEQAAPQDLHRAFDLVEGDIVFHAAGFAPLLSYLEQAFSTLLAPPTTS